jgi:hypothetical protein
MNRICGQCSLEKDILSFRHQAKSDKINISRICKKCDYENGKKRHKNFRELHREELKQVNKNYYTENKAEIKDRQKDKKPIWDKIYYEKNKKKIQQIQSRRAKERYQNDPNFRMRKVVSKAISRALKLNNHSKNGKSCLNFLPYTIRQFKEYLESKFEPWMNWNNYGVYKADMLTWQIDHIIPQSDLPYISMEDENFKKCWSLDNLRPLSSKQNMMDGINKTRHQKKAA